MAFGANIEKGSPKGYFLNFLAKSSVFIGHSPRVALSALSFLSLSDPKKDTAAHR